MQVNFREYSGDNVPKNDTTKLVDLNSEYNFSKNSTEKVKNMMTNNKKETKNLVFSFMRVGCAH